MANSMSFAPAATPHIADRGNVVTGYALGGCSPGFALHLACSMYTMAGCDVGRKIESWHDGYNEQMCRENMGQKKRKNHREQPPTCEK